LLFATSCRSGAFAEAEARCKLPLGASANSGEAVAVSDLLGRYRGRPWESGNVEVTLREQGNAELVVEAKVAAGAEAEEPRRLDASWAQKGAYIEFRYGAFCDTLQFDPALGLERLGAEGDAPGLVGVHAFRSDSLLLGRHLWRMPATGNAQP